MDLIFENFINIYLDEIVVIYVMSMNLMLILLIKWQLILNGKNANLSCVNILEISV